MEISIDGKFKELLECIKFNQVKVILRINMNSYIINLAFEWFSFLCNYCQL